jgi:hypothetical protein
MDKNGRLIARVIGGFSLACGVASAILAVWAVDQQFASRGIVQISAAAAIVVFLSIAAFCCLVGYRLVFNRPNRNGSLLCYRLDDAGPMFLDRRIDDGCNRNGARGISAF